jgi:hypothetical protein
MVWSKLRALQFRSSVAKGPQEELPTIVPLHENDALRYGTTLHDLFGTPNVVMVPLWADSSVMSPTPANRTFGQSNNAQHELFLGVFVASCDSISDMEMELLTTGASQLSSAIIQVMAFSSVRVSHACVLSPASTPTTSTVLSTLDHATTRVLEYYSPTCIFADLICQPTDELT